MHILRILFMGASLLLGACASSPDTAAKDAAAGPAKNVHAPPGFGVGEYRIGVDDGIRVSVWRNPELSITVPVRPDGKISVPLVGDVQAGGNTPEEVAAIIESELSRYVRNPSVSVIVTQLRSHEFLTRIRVTGAVRAPRSMPYRQGMTVLDAVLEAGGVNEFAAPGRTKLYRKSDTGTKVKKVDLDDILQKGKLKTNYDLMPGDIITVPERIF